jgi:hypothetical protein
MNHLTNVARLATFAVIRQEFERRDSKATAHANNVIAAAWTNFLFGAEPNEEHRQHLDLAAEERAALGWLKGHAVHRELAVQSLRVAATIKGARGGSVWPPTPTLRVLEEFGPEFPNEPSPGSYDELVMRAVQLLPPEEQRAIAEVAGARQVSPPTRK